MLINFDDNIDQGLLNCLESFYENIINNSVDLEYDFARIINDNIESLLA